MLAKEQAEIDLKVEPITNMTWNKYDKAYIEETYGLLKDNYQRVMKAQENVHKILASINSWGEVPLYMRKDHHTDALLEISNRDAIVGTRLRKCLVTKRLIEKVVLDENYRLYFNILPSCPCSSGSDDDEDGDIDEDLDSRRRSRSASTRHQTIESLGDVSKLREHFVSSIVIDNEHIELYRPYQEYIDNMVGNAIMAAIHTRYV